MRVRSPFGWWRRFWFGWDRGAEDSCLKLQVDKLYISNYWLLVVSLTQDEAYLFLYHVNSNNNILCDL